MSAAPASQTQALSDELRQRAAVFVAGVDLQSDHVSPWRSVFWLTASRDGERFRVTGESIS